MKITTSDKAIAYLALISGLTISAVAVWYSVAGLVSIFAAAVTPIIVMGVALEVSKLIATVWLKLNWQRAPIFIKTYMTMAVAILMVITSMGIFGFLSKAHSDQSLVSGDVQSKIAVYDEKIKTAKENIDANRKALKQMDEAVDQVMGRSQDEKGADKAVALRKGQAKERTRLLSEITAEQKVITQLSEERAPIAAEVRKVEAEVGPIKYIAAFIYGDNPDANILEKAVTWVIIIIVSVFDPLAVILLLASQYSFQWFRKQEEEAEEEMREEYDFSEGVRGPVVEAANEDKMEQDVSEFFEKGKLVAKVLDYEEAERIANEANEKLADIEKEEPTLESVGVIPEYTVEDADEEPIEEVLEDEHIDDDPIHVKVAKASWKNDNPEDSLKHQRQLLESGVISVLPWELPPYTMLPTADNDIPDLERPGDYLTPPDESKTVWIEKDGNRQVRKEIDGYQQNAEQSNNTLWKRIKDSKE